VPNSALVFIKYSLHHRISIRGALLITGSTNSDNTKIFYLGN